MAQLPVGIFIDRKRKSMAAFQAGEVGKKEVHLFFTEMETESAFRTDSGRVHKVGILYFDTSCKVPSFLGAFCFLRLWTLWRNQFKLITQTSRHMS